MTNYKEQCRKNILSFYLYKSSVYYNTGGCHGSNSMQAA